MMTSKGFSAETEARQMKELHKCLKKSTPFVVSQAKSGCLVSELMHDYVARVIKTDHVNNNILSVSSPLWSGSGKTEGSFIDEFTIVSRLPGYSGNFLNVRRVVKEDVEWNRHHALGFTREFHTTIKNRVAYKTGARDVLMLVLGESLKKIMLLCKKLVSFRVDNGMYLTFKEKARSNRYVEIYIGGWMDEVQFPLSDYQNKQIIGRLGKTA